MTVLEMIRPAGLPRLSGLGSLMRRGLDRTYLACGYLAAACMVAILVLTMTQVIGRMTGINLRGISSYAGYFMAASAFLAFAHTLNAGAHIRIELFLSVLGSRRAGLEKLAFFLSTAIACWLAYYSCSLVYWSYVLGDISQGLDATPMWIPQLAMAFGTCLFAVSLADHLVQLMLTGKHGIKPSTEIL